MLKRTLVSFWNILGIVKSSSPHYPFYFKDGKVLLTFLYPITLPLLLFLL